MSFSNVGLQNPNAGVGGGLGGGASAAPSSAPGIGSGFGNSVGGGLGPGIGNFLPPELTDFGHWTEQAGNFGLAGEALANELRRRIQDWLSQDSPQVRNPPSVTPPVVQEAPPPPFTGGQSAVNYDVTLQYKQVLYDNNCVSYVNSYTITVLGPIKGVFVDYGIARVTPPWSGCGGGITYYNHSTLGVLRGNNERHVVFTGQGYGPQSDWKILSVRRTDGAVDTGGNLGGSGTGIGGAAGGFGGADLGAALGGGASAGGSSDWLPVGAGNLGTWNNTGSSLGGGRTGAGTGTGVGAGVGAGAGTGAGASSGAGAGAGAGADGLGEVPAGLRLPGEPPGTLAPPGTAGAPTIVPVPSFLPGTDVAPGTFAPADGSRPPSDPKNQREPEPRVIPIPLPPCLPTIGQCQTPTCSDSDKETVEIEPISGVFTAKSDCGDDEPIEFSWVGKEFFGIEAAFGALNSRLNLLEELICAKDCNSGIPAWWEYVKAGDCPQYELLMRSHEKYGGKYVYRYFHIPNPIPNPQDDDFPGWIVGKVSVKVRFPDNRSILVYAVSEAEGRRVVNTLASKTGYPQPYQISVTYTTRDIEEIDYIPWLVRYKLPSDGFKQWQWETKMSRDTGEGGYPSP